MGAAAKEKTYGLLLLNKPEANQTLVQAVRASILNVAEKTGLHVLGTQEMPGGKPLEQVMRDCHGQLGCLADSAGKAKADAVLIARVMVSKVVSTGVVMQFLVVSTSTHAVERKCGLEIGVIDDADIAVRANYLSLFGSEMPLGIGGDKYGSRAQVFGAMKRQIDDLESRLAKLDASAPTQEDLDLMDDVVSSMQTLLALFQSQLYDMDSMSVPRWLRQAPNAAPSAPSAADQH